MSFLVICGFIKRVVGGCFIFCIMFIVRSVVLVVIKVFNCFMLAKVFSFRWVCCVNYKGTGVLRVIFVMFVSVFFYIFVCAGYRLWGDDFQFYTILLTVCLVVVFGLVGGWVIYLLLWCCCLLFRTSAFQAENNGSIPLKFKFGGWV